ncbi:MAG: hypothetical protein RMJ38_01110 [candidate division WOR-3 bacterium]|nr:hypothetical protein [candidate division WOR-3 bacterium]MDW8150028.1 hypothetical protein [candidate division WOR-3 bacterium]
MKEKLYEIISGLSKKDIALLAIGENVNISLPSDVNDYVAQNPDILSLIATEILAKQKGYKIEETDVIKLKRDGEWVGDYALYKYNDDYYIIIEDTVYKLQKVEKLEPLKTQQRTQSQQKPETLKPTRPRANIE